MYILNQKPLVVVGINFAVSTQVFQNRVSLSINGMFLYSALANPPKNKNEHIKIENSFFSGSICIVWAYDFLRKRAARAGGRA